MSSITSSQASGALPPLPPLPPAPKPPTVSPKQIPVIVKQALPPLPPTPTLPPLPPRPNAKEKEVEISYDPETFRTERSIHATLPPPLDPSNNRDPYGENEIDFEDPSIRRVESPENEGVDKPAEKAGFWKKHGKSILKAGIIFGLIVGYTVVTAVALTACWPLGLSMLLVASFALGFYMGWQWDNLEKMIGLNPDQAYLNAVNRTNHRV